MKRMTDNPISFYTVKKDDLKNIVPQGQGLFDYTPSPEFLEVLKDFKSALRVDWSTIAPTLATGAPFSVLYPTSTPYILDENGPIGYAYYGDTFNKVIKMTFFYLNGKYSFNLKIIE